MFRRVALQDAERQGAVEPCSDPEVSKDASGLTKPNCGSKAERERGLPRTLCTDGDVQAALPPERAV